MPEGGEPYLNHLLLDVSSIFENIMIFKASDYCFRSCRDWEERNPFHSHNPVTGAIITSIVCAIISRYNLTFDNNIII